MAQSAPHNPIGNRGGSTRLLGALASLALLGFAIGWCLFAVHLLEVRCGASCDLHPYHWEQDEGAWQWYAQLPIAIAGLGVVLWAAADRVQGRSAHVWMQLALILALFDAWVLFTSRAAISLP